MHIDRYEPVRSSGYVPLSDWINRKKAMVNIQNNDNLCFLYAVESELQDSVSTNPRFYERSLIQNYRPWFDMMPMRLSDIKLFEWEFDISINVYEPLGVDQVRPMRLSSYRGDTSLATNHIDLMLYKRHYSRIVDLSRLLSKQISNNTRKKFICKRCLNHFCTRQDLDQHISLCHTHGNTIDIMPKEGVRDASVKLKNHERKLKHLFVLYADFESIIKPIHGCKPNTDTSFTTLNALLVRG